MVIDRVNFYRAMKRFIKFNDQNMIHDIEPVPERGGPDINIPEFGPVKTNIR